MEKSPATAEDVNTPVSETTQPMRIGGGVCARARLPATTSAPAPNMPAARRRVIGNVVAIARFLLLWRQCQDKGCPALC
jgi:hypothetical protein